jgi:phage RecT family recombinase
MARSPAGPPPVETSAVARVSTVEGRKDIQNYQEIAQAFQREDRRATLLAFFGGNEELAKRFVAVALHAISSDSDLLINADPLSVIEAIKDSAALGLEPTGLNGEGWILRYKRQATFQPGWRGYLKRIRNSRAVRDIDTQLVYENDQFDWGFTEKGGWFRHTPAKLVRDPESNGWVGRGDYWGAYAYAVMPSGFTELEVMSVVDINAVRDAHSESWKSGKNSPWMTDWGEMARKTPLRRLSKRLPQSAVDMLLEADARADALAEQDAAGPKIDVSAVRNAALNAVNGTPQVAAAALTTPIAPPDPEEADDTPAHQDEDGNPTHPGHREGQPEAADGEAREEPASGEPPPDGSVAAGTAEEPLVVDGEPDLPWAGAPRPEEDPTQWPAP